MELFNLGIYLEIAGFILFLPMIRTAIVHLDFIFEVIKNWKQYEKHTQKYTQTKKEFFWRSYKVKIIEILVFTGSWYGYNAKPKIFSKEFADQVMRYFSIGLIVAGLILQLQ